MDHGPLRLPKSGQEVCDPVLGVRVVAASEARIVVSFLDVDDEQRGCARQCAAGLSHL
jgi:hypothetical protein